MKPSNVHAIHEFIHVDDLVDELVDSLDESVMLFAPKLQHDELNLRCPPDGGSPLQPFALMAFGCDDLVHELRACQMFWSPW